MFFSPSLIPVAAETGNLLDDNAIFASLFVAFHRPCPIARGAAAPPQAEARLAHCPRGPLQDACLPDAQLPVILRRNPCPPYGHPSPAGSQKSIVLDGRVSLFLDDTQGIHSYHSAAPAAPWTGRIR